MSTKLKMESLTVMGFFNEDRRIYIPDYQRAYSWSKNQLEQWVTDLREIVEAGQQYYLGRILLEGPDDKNRFAVVDGQQRLTTILLFLWEMGRKVDLSELGCKFENWIEQFQIAGVDDDFFTRQMEGERLLRTTETNSQKLILEAIKYFTKLEKVDYEALTKTLLNAQLPTITVKGKRDAALMFQLENDRGVLLTQMEKLKAYLMYEAILFTGDEHTDVLNIISKKFDKIGRICFTIREKPDSILRAHYQACLTGSRNPYRDYSLDVIKEHLREEFEDNIRAGIEEFCDELLISFEAIENLENLDHEIYTEHFQFFTIPDYVLPILLVSYRKDIFKNEDESEQLLDILSKLILRQESVASRNARQTDIKTKPRLGSILEEFRNSHEEDALEQLVEKIESGFEEWRVQYLKSSSSKLWSRDKFKEWLEEGQYPDSIAKFFLFMYETHKIKGSVDIKKNWTLEHISPQSKKERAGDGWATTGESDDRRQEELEALESGSYIQYIGNLCLLERHANSSAGARSFREKRKIYERKDSLFHVQKISSFATNRRSLWAIEAIRERGRKLIEFICNRWLLPSELVEYQEEMRKYQERRTCAESLNIKLKKFKPSPPKEDEMEYYFDLGLEEVDEKSTHIRVYVSSEDSSPDYYIQARFWLDQIADSDEESGDVVQEIIRDNIDFDDEEDGWGGIYPKEELDDFVQKLKQTIAKISEAGFEPLPS